MTGVWRMVLSICEECCNVDNEGQLAPEMGLDGEYECPMEGIELPDALERLIPKCKTGDKIIIYCDLEE